MKVANRGLPIWNPKGQRGVTAVQKIVEDELGWIFRPIGSNDVGIDGLAEIVEDNFVQGKMIALQIKSGASYFREAPGGFRYHGKKKHLSYWLGYCLPVFLVLHDPASGKAYWQKIERRLVNETDKGWSIFIPAQNRFDRSARRPLSDGIAADPQAKRRLYFELDYDLMRQVAARQSTFFVIDIRYNKGLSFRGIQVFYDSWCKAVPDDEIVQWYHAADVGRVITELYPWLEYDYAAPVEDIAGEASRHVLEVRLSSTAKAYLIAEEYFRTGVTDFVPPEPEYESDGVMDEEEHMEWAFNEAMGKD